MKNADGLPVKLHSDDVVGQFKYAIEMAYNRDPHNGIGFAIFTGHGYSNGMFGRNQQMETTTYSLTRKEVEKLGDMSGFFMRQGVIILTGCNTGTDTYFGTYLYDNSQNTSFAQSMADLTNCDVIAASQNKTNPNNPQVSGQVAPLIIDNKECGSILSYPNNADFCIFNKNKAPQTYGSKIDNRQVFGSYMLKQVEQNKDTDKVQNDK